MMICLSLGFDELRCDCGAEVVYPPIPCGTPPPPCTRTCSRVHPCNHPGECQVHPTRSCTASVVTMATYIHSFYQTNSPFTHTHTNTHTLTHTLTLLTHSLNHPLTSPLAQPLFEYQTPCLLCNLIRTLLMYLSANPYSPTLLPSSLHLLLSPPPTCSVPYMSQG